MDNEIRVYLVTEDNNIMGHADDSRLGALAWYLRLWAKINRRYKNKYIDVKAFKCKFE